MIRVGVLTGLRRSALCRLRWADVDLNHQLLTVRNRGEEKTKSGHARRGGDQINTRDPSSFYEAFDLQTARCLTQRLEIHYTPKHGSWLNMAEIENSALGKQCLSQRIPEQEMMAEEANSWKEQRNKAGASVDGRFQTEDARIELERLYPKA